MEFKTGDKVSRKKTPPPFMCNVGTIIEIDEYDHCKIKWDEPAKTGQQHSTLNKKILIKALGKETKE